MDQSGSASLRVAQGGSGWLRVCHVCTGEATDGLLYVADGAGGLLCVDLGGRRIMKKKMYNKDELRPILHRP